MDSRQLTKCTTLYGSEVKKSKMKDSGNSVFTCGTMNAVVLISCAVSWIHRCTVLKRCQAVFQHDNHSEHTCRASVSENELGESDTMAEYLLIWTWSEFMKMSEATFSLQKNEKR